MRETELAAIGVQRGVASQAVVVAAMALEVVLVAVAKEGECEVVKAEAVLGEVVVAAGGVNVEVPTADTPAWSGILVRR